ncbi:hypothetical protein AYL99_00928 [Fonsecaea erecta]|uniref:Uncharacterized protein n=1 Tax=Fonsecaea erecta TaxID=1367422 RepID=A0A179A021_9EURO|nr:hypothetical protein AYL99_00928 [Fonsecaea erecta]OAP64956.1 hypothetical protein AYL99_00928 [Fonsecaea erecta]
MASFLEATWSDSTVASSSFSNPEPSGPTVLARTKHQPNGLKFVSTPALAPTVCHNCTPTATLPNHERFSLEGWISTFSKVGLHSFLHKVYDMETTSWYYILYYQGDIARSTLSDEGRQFLETVHPRNLVFEKTSLQEGRRGEMRVEFWPTSSRGLLSCHYRCLWRIPAADLKMWEDGDDGERGHMFRDSGYNSDYTGHFKKGDLKESRGGGGIRGTESGQHNALNYEDEEEKGGEDEDMGLDTDQVDGKHSSSIERAFPVALRAILWGRPSLTGEYYTTCTRDSAEYLFRWEVENDAAKIRAIRLARRKAECSDRSEEGLVSTRREQQLVQLLDDVVVRHPFQYSNLKETLWRYL